MEKRTASPEEKIALLNQYRLIINEYSLPNRINIYGDYAAILNNDAKAKVKRK